MAVSIDINIRAFIVISPKELDLIQNDSEILVAAPDKIEFFKKNKLTKNRN